METSKKNLYNGVEAKRVKVKFPKQLILNYKRMIVVLTVPSLRKLFA